MTTLEATARDDLRELDAQPVGAGDLQFLAQAARLFEDAGVHLTEWRARGIDPVARLEHLHSAPPPDQGALYRALLAIFAAFGDRHSRCVLPPRWSERFAYLPFVVGACNSTLLVTGSATDSVRPGDRLISWNGRPIGEVLRAHAAWQLGANEAARWAKAVQTLTVRPLALLPPPPDEPVALVTGGPTGERVTELFWRFGDARRVARDLAACLPPDDGWHMGPYGILSRTVRHPDGPVGWVRIPALRVSAAQFLPALSAVLERQPSRLVLDLRGCEEGFVQTGEQMLRLFTDRPIAPLRFELRTTDFMRALVRDRSAMAQWRAPIEAAAAAGRSHSGGLPLTSLDGPAGPAQVYRGRLLLLVDALTYSTAEMFAASVQDHGLGTVMGVAPRTGGGGGVAWSQDLLHRSSGDAFLAGAPGAPSLRMAVLRCRRTGAQAMRLIEGEGVVPDVLHRTTRRDLLCGDADLIAHAARVLGEMR